MATEIEQQFRIFVFLNIKSLYFLNPKFDLKLDNIYKVMVKNIFD
jgi:hypothetical protein